MGRLERASPAHDAKDAYRELLEPEASVHAPMSEARRTWVAQLVLAGTDDALFRMETLLKGAACFANPRNHPGPPMRVAVVARDFREALELARDGLVEAVTLSRQLLGEREREFVFQRYLENLVPHDSVRARLFDDSDVQNPEQALLTLRHALGQSLEVAGGLIRQPRVPYRQFFSLLSIVQREVARAHYFGPAPPLAFRGEFDRITHPGILDGTRALKSDGARRIVALTFLGLFRLLRYAEMVGALAEGAKTDRSRGGAIYLVLAALRSDVRALEGHLVHHAGRELANGFGRTVFDPAASEIRSRYSELLAHGEQLRALKASLVAIASSLRLEVRRIFSYEIPSPEIGPSAADIADAAARATELLKPAIQSAIVFLADTVGREIDPESTFDDTRAKAAISERLRRDVWMFAQVVRAFVDKSRSMRGDSEGWGDASSADFVEAFARYFRSIGYPLLRRGDEDRVSRFVRMATAMTEGELSPTVSWEQIVGEAETFHAFLGELFESIGKRQELAGVTFDRKAAAATLQRYVTSGGRAGP